LCATKCGVGCGIREDNGSVGSIANGGVSGDFQSADHLAEGLFASSASSQSFEGGYSDCSQESHNADDGEEFDEGECRWRAARMLQFVIFDFEFLIGRGDGLMRNPDKNSVRWHGNK
jgi:hypothetical protein